MVSRGGEGMARWRGKVALVTGASAGIGRAVARRLADEGLRVVGWGRRAEALEALGEELEGRDFAWRSVELRELAQLRAAFDALRATHGGVDVLVNSAGVSGDAPLVGGDPERWREILDVNVIALATCTSLAVDDMRRRGDAGHVVHVSSLSGHRVTRGGAMYAASKHAVRAMTEGLRGELRALASGIRVTAISPGNVATDFVARVFADYEPPPYPILEAKDVADAVAHVLAAPDHVAYHDLLMRPAQQVT